MKGEAQYVRNYFDRRRGFDVARCPAHLASQSRVGLLPEWRTWLDSFDSDHSDAVGPVLGGRNVFCHMQKLVQAVLNQSGKLGPQFC